MGTEISLIARFNSLLRHKKISVPMRGEFPRNYNSVNRLPYLASLSRSQGLNGQNSLFFVSQLAGMGNFRDELSSRTRPL